MSNPRAGEKAINVSLRLTETERARYRAAAEAAGPTINRLLDPDDTGLTFVTLAKASAALDLELLVSLEQRPSTKPGRKRR